VTYYAGPQVSSFLYEQLAAAGVEVTATTAAAVSVASAAAAAAAGNAAGQIAGDITGVHQGFSWGEVGQSALSAAATAGVTSGLQGSTAFTAGVDSAGQPVLNGWGQALQGAGSYAGDVIASKITGQPTHFSWAGLVSNSLANRASGALGDTVASMGINRYGDSDYLQRLESRALGDVVRKVTGSALGDNHVQSWQQIGEDVAGNALGMGVTSEFPLRAGGDAADQASGSSRQQDSVGGAYDPMNPLSQWNGQGGQSGLAIGLPTQDTPYDSMNPLTLWNSQGGQDELAFELRAQSIVDDSPRVAALDGYTTHVAVKGLPSLSDDQGEVTMVHQGDKLRIERNPDGSYRTWTDHAIDGLTGPQLGDAGRSSWQPSVTNLDAVSVSATVFDAPGLEVPSLTVSDLVPSQSLAIRDIQSTYALQAMDSGSKAAIDGGSYQSLDSNAWRFGSASDYAKAEEALKDVVPGSARQTELMRNLVVAGLQSRNPVEQAQANIISKALDASRRQEEIDFYGAPLPKVGAVPDNTEQRKAELQEQAARTGWLSMVAYGYADRFHGTPEQIQQTMDLADQIGQALSHHVAYTGATKRSSTGRSASAGSRSRANRGAGATIDEMTGGNGRTDEGAGANPRYQQYKALRGEGLKASDAFAVVSGKSSVSQLGDGTVVASLGSSAHLESRLLGDGVLYIDSTFVAGSLRGKGISTDLFNKTLSYVGRQNVRTVQSYFGPGTNLDVVRAGMEAGMTPSQAAALTPRGRTAIQAGFTKIQYDPFTGIFSASR